MNFFWRKKYKAEDALPSKKAHRWRSLTLFGVTLPALILSLTACYVPNIGTEAVAYESTKNIDARLEMLADDPRVLRQPVRTAPSNLLVARAYMEGAALQEYALSCIRRGSVYSNPQAEKIVALTFDDGPFPDKTPQILQILGEYDARATFFVLGRYVENNPNLAQDILAANCELGSHSWYHSRQTALSAEQRLADIARVDAAFSEAVGFDPYLFRAPYGEINEAVRNDLTEQHMISVLWSVDPEDWRATSAKQVYNNVLNNTKSGDVILLHENGEHTLEALPQILAALQEKGFTIVTVSELVYAGSEAQAAAEAAHIAE